MKFTWVVLFTLWSVAGAASAQNILVVGDSVMAWNGSRGQAIGDALARETGLSVRDKAVPGAEFSREGAFKGLLDIRRQARRETPDVLIFTGGGNDLMRACGCRSCRAQVDALIAPNLRGEITNFAVPLTRKGTQVIYLGYYGEPRGGGPFGACGPDLDIVDQRVAQLANRVPGLTFVSAKDAINQNDLSLYDPDRIHPSPKGSALIAKRLADALKTLRQP